MRTLAVILARAGSKGLPRKNALPLCGRPIARWTIDCACGAASVDRVVVTTDDPDVADAARAASLTVIDRPPDLAHDTATVDAATHHAVEAAEAAERSTYDAVVILYANVPLRPDGLVDRAVAKLRETGCDSVQSVCPVGKSHPHWMKRLGGAGGDRIEPLTPNAVYRRQDLPPLYMLDGGIIAVRRAALFTTDPADPHAFLGSDRRAVVTQPGEVVDIDTSLDLAIAESLLTRRLGQTLPPSVAIGSRTVARGSPAYVIAELGVNHDGSVDRALGLTRAAARAGADAVKLQLFDARVLLSAEAKLASYQESAAADPFEMLDALQLAVDDMLRVRTLAAELGLAFIVTCFSPGLVADLGRLAPDAIKIASPDAVNRPLVEALAALGPPLIVSTGTCDMAEVHDLVGWVAPHPTILLHCVSAYPTPTDRATLNAIGALALYGCPVGYSDHTLDIHTGMLAVAHGARVVEKHLTHDRDASGPDHAASLEPDDLRRYIELIRLAEAAAGPARIKAPLDIEADVRRVSRQSLCATADMPAGHTLEPGDLATKRPGTGLPASRLESTLGRTLRRAVAADRLLREDDLEPR